MIVYRGISQKNKTKQISLDLQMNRQPVRVELGEGMTGRTDEICAGLVILIAQLVITFVTSGMHFSADRYPVGTKDNSNQLQCIL